MSDFGDIEPEDAWDADDPVPEQIDNVRRRVVLLGQIRERFDDDHDPIDAVDELQHLVERAQARRDLSERDLLRIRDSLDDLDWIRSRL